MPAHKVIISCAITGSFHTPSMSPYLPVTPAEIAESVRVGLEDSLWLGKGQLAESNAAHVSRARQITEGLGLSIATPDEARGILALKGGDKVGF